MAITRNELKIIKSLLLKKGRKKERKYLAEGVRLLEESYNYQIMPEMILYSKSMVDDRIEQLLSNFDKKQAKILNIPAKDIQSLSDTKSPQGIVGVFKTKEKKAGELSLKKIRKILWCEDISDPGNLGTLLRSALAFGFKTVMISGKSADVYSPKVVRSTMGAIFKLNIIKDNEMQLLSVIKDNRFKLVASEMEGKPLHFVLKQLKNSRIVLAVGSEAFGLSQEIISAADIQVRIDHEKSIESLNAAVAGSILMNEFYKAE